MTDHGPGHGHDHDPAPETKDVDLRRVSVLGVWLVATLAVVIVLMWGMFSWFAAREAASQPPPSTLTSAPKGQLPPEPRLQANPLEEVRSLRAEEEAILGGYGWVDRENGIVRIPVDRAVDIVLERGLPARGPAAQEEAQP